MLVLLIKRLIILILLVALDNVLDLYKKLSIEKKISNLRFLESDKVTVAVRWVPILFPIDTLQQYLETRYGCVLRHVGKVGKMGFKMRKDDLNENPIGSYVYISGPEFLIRYNSELETRHI